MSLFKGLKRQLADLQSPRTLHDLHNIAGRAIHAQVMQGFARERDPDGSPWAPTKRRNKILQDTLALRDGIRWKADSRGVLIRTTGAANRYAAFHQKGTRARRQSVKRGGRFIRNSRGAKRKTDRAVQIPGLPARKFLPDQGIIPAGYALAIQNDFRVYFRQRYGGRP